ncbi:acyltransferase family protein [Aquihabitans daechungensis]|uniref:acyltransferase family protein n=1 Tax=Aquihabitans daechungensis TaxID=1052257 RepID=UPI003B9E2F4A
MRFPTFEGLRALCAFGVLAYHAGTFTDVDWGRAGSMGTPGAWLQHLSVGVSVFFVLSGFLLFRPFVAAHLADEARPRIRSYLWRRMVRIYPAYWIALFLSTLILGLDLGDWWGHVRFYSLIQIYWGDTVLGGIVQAWTLATEVSFYLFLPIWVLVLCRRGGTLDQRVRRHYLGLAVLYLVGVTVRGLLRAGEHHIGYGTLAANCDLFAIGMALAVASAAAQVRGRVRVASPARWGSCRGWRGSQPRAATPGWSRCGTPTASIRPRSARRSCARSSSASSPRSWWPRGSSAPRIRGWCGGSCAGVPWWAPGSSPTASTCGTSRS